MGSFVRVILLIDLVILVLGYWPTQMAVGGGHFLVLVLACILTTLSVAMSYYSISKSMEKKMGQMMGTVFGGMGLRLLLLLASVVAVIFLTDLPQFSFIISLFICYISKSVAEIIFINRIQNKSLSSN
ncbi:MAG: hypothetical protein LC662_08265 [Rhodothermaceae bacterium]|nr:hypothetical protein [Rhodothermaceae bacterium]